MAAGLASMQLADREAFQRLDDLGAKLRAGLEDCLERAGVPGSVSGVGSLFRIHPVKREFVDYRSTRLDERETERLARLVRNLLDHGVLVAPTGLGCLSTPMADAELEWLLETFAACLDDVAKV
jgi:glutamate-1-semialdehyde 2,1-aminomutase